MTTADDPQASLLQQLPLLLSLLWTALPSNANFQGAREVSRPPLVEGSTTVGAISQHRRSQAHKDLVTQYTSHLRVLLRGTASPFLSPTEPTSGGFLSPLSPAAIIPSVNTTGYQAERLHDIVCDASNSFKSAIFERLSRYLRDFFQHGSPHHRPAAATHQHYRQLKIEKIPC